MRLRTPPELANSPVHILNGPPLTFLEYATLISSNYGTYDHNPYGYEFGDLRGIVETFYEASRSPYGSVEVRLTQEDATSLYWVLEYHNYGELPPEALEGGSDAKPTS
jgi:hypothetical protein